MNNVVTTLVQREQLDLLKFHFVSHKSEAKEQKKGHKWRAHKASTCIVVLDLIYQTSKLKRSIYKFQEQKNASQ